MTKKVCLGHFSMGEEKAEQEEVAESTIVNTREGAHDSGRQFRSSDLFFPGLNDDVALECLARVSRSDYPSLSCINKRYHSLLKSGSLYELRKQLGIVEHWVYLVCDPRGWEAFDPFGKRWMTLPKIPCDDCFNHADKESLAVGSELLVFGREMFEFAIWKYSLISSSWVKCEGMNRPRCLFGSGCCGSIAILAGGTDKNGNVLKSAELYDSSSGRWELLPNMHTQRKLCSGFFMDGKFYVIGGMSGPTVSLTCGEEYDLETREWRKIEGMSPNVSTAAHAPPLVAVVGNQLYAFESLTNMVKKYDKVKNTWDELGRLPVRADSSDGWGLAFKACGEELLVVGGQRVPEGVAIVLNSWSPKSGVNNGNLDWKVLGVKENVGVFVYNCAVMGC
ncbi:F-box/kelch-repeat protein [Tripterygium wilfordii]|uniref:F-box/kelch-repeat protein n=1 Tax=Tripterygium wilfordii TaxID=458696 RepID=A0A7J7DYY3_TRIWF|nr:F-box/kelch-repeat protein At5g60570-like [Tripterygium wilfordii]XP_038720574.1 F-box/kelch-repeat protein At5g60570-like [Tripterygium wilfordii]KAF5751537.1 F-box/kelch-repeat protein [Tripterygium wilfordii]